MQQPTYTNTYQTDRRGGRGGRGRGAYRKTGRNKSIKPNFNGNSTKNRLIKSKAVVRNIPITTTKDDFLQLLEEHQLNPDQLIYYRQGKPRKNERLAMPSVAFLSFKAQPDTIPAALEDIRTWNIKNADGEAVQLQADYAPYQKLPRASTRRDPKMNTIETNPEYLAFVSKLAEPAQKLQSADVQLDARMAEESVDQEQVPLVKFLLDRRNKRGYASGNRSKGGRGSGGRGKDSEGKKAKNKKNKAKTPEPKSKKKSRRTRAREAAAAEAKPDITVTKIATGNEAPAMTPPLPSPPVLDNGTPPAQPTNTAKSTRSTRGGKSSRGRGGRGGRGRGRGRGPDHEVKKIWRPAQPDGSSRG